MALLTHLVMFYTYYKLSKNIERDFGIKYSKLFQGLWLITYITVLNLMQINI